MLNFRALRFPWGGSSAGFGLFQAVFVFLGLAIGSAPSLAQAPTSGAFQFAQKSYTFSEEDPTALITVTRITGAWGKMQVDYATADGTATNGTDYTETKGTLTFNHWQTRGQFTVPLKKSTGTNAVKFTIALSNPRLAPDEDPSLLPPSITSSNTTVNILQTENSLNFTASYWSVPEGGGQVRLMVKSGQGFTNGLSVDYAIGPIPFDAFLSAGSDYAAAGTDFDLLDADGNPIQRGTLTFDDADTKEITVAILPDNLLEFNEDFQIVLSNPQGSFVDPADTNQPPTNTIALKLGPVSKATVTIVNATGGTNQHAAGTLDRTFNPNSVAPNFLANPGANGVVYSLSLQSDNKIVVGGDFTGFNAQSFTRVTRLLTNGLVDPAFNPGSGANRAVQAVASYPTGNRRNRTLVGGSFTSFNGTQRNSIARLNENGSLDTTFNPGNGANGPIYALAPAACGGALVVGDFTSFDGVSKGRIAMLNDNGSLVQSFATGLGANGPINALAVKGPDPVAITFNRDGPDTNKFTRTVPTTGGCGTVRVSFASYEDDILNVYQGTRLLFTSGLTNTSTVVTDPATGNSTTNANPIVGVFDFSPTGLPADNQLRFEINASLTNDTARYEFSAQIQLDGLARIIIGGDFTQYDGVPVGGIAELNLDGSLNRNFDTGLGASGSINSLFIQGDGSVVAGGQFNGFNGFTRVNLVRLSSTGAVDPAFQPTPDGPVLSIAASGTNMLYVAGNFSYISQAHRAGFARLLPDGAVDTSWLDGAYNQNAGMATANGLAPVGFVSTILEQPDGNVLIGGSFNSIGAGDGGSVRLDTRPRRNVARLLGGNTPGPGNLAFAAPAFGADEDAGTLSAGVARQNGTLGSVSVSATTIPGVATEKVDYTPVNANLTWGYNTYFSAGASATTTVPVKIIDDNLIEGDEDFSIALNQPLSQLFLGGELILTIPALGSFPAAPAVIVDNDVLPNIVTFSQAEYVVNEDAVNAVITVLRTNGLSGTVSVNYSTADGTAKAGEDYDRASGSLIFGPGVTSRTFTIHLRNNDLIEDDETVLIRLSNPTGGSLGSISNAVLTIVDDDFLPGRVSFTTTNYNVVESEPFATVSVRRAGGTAGVLSVDYRTADGTASALQPDYAETSGTLTWNDGETANKIIQIPIQNDGLVEPNETILLSLSNPRVNGELIPLALGTRTNATVTILNDDFFGSLAFASTNLIADENGGAVNVIVVRQNGSAEEVSVDYATLTNGTAVVGQDYTPVNGTLTFGVGELSKMFTIPILDDSVKDGTKTIQVRLSNPVNGSLGAITNLTVTILDNETVNLPAGSLDTGFDVGSGANSTIYTAAVQPDGKILISGDFTTFNDQLRVRITRLTSEGRLDTTFNPNAAVNGAIRAMLLQKDGRIMIGGTFGTVNSVTRNNIARMSAGGTLDGTFEPGSGSDGAIYSLAELLSGNTNIPSKVLAGGAFNSIDSVNRRNVARLNGDGSVDRSFSPGTAANATVYAVLQLPDGKSLIGGDFTAYNGVTRGFLAKINVDGTLDTTFDTGLGADGSVRAITQQVDQKILIGGLFTSVSGVPSPHIARLNPDGTVDPSFSPGSGADGPVYSIGVQADGRIVIGGDFQSYAGVTRTRIARLNGDGSVDTTINFGTGADAFISSVAIQADRKIVVAGGFTSFNGQARNHIARIYGGSLAGAGEIEFVSPSFVVNEIATNAVITLRRTGGTTGAVTVDYATTPGTATPLVDYIELNGTVTFASGETFRVINVPIIDDVLPEDDETLGLALSNPTGGAVLGRQPVATLTIVSDDSVIGFSEPAYIVNENAPGGRAIITITRAGESTRAVTVRFSTADGTAQAGLDYTAVNNLLVNFPPGTNAVTVSVTILNDSLVEDNEVLNLRLTNPTGGGVLGQANATLTIMDDDFAPGVLSFAGSPSVSEGAGVATVTVNRVSGHTGSVTVDYTTVATGTATEGVDYERTSGTLTFLDNESTKTFVIPIKDDASVEGNETLQVRLSNPTGGAILGALTNITLTIIDDDIGPGSLDQTFNAQLGGNGQVRALQVQLDGKLVIGGGFTSAGGRAASRVARLNPDGTVDASFTSNQGPDATVSALALGPSGKVDIGGLFRSIGIIQRSYAGVLTSNGVPDVNFSQNAGENGEVMAIAGQPDGKVIIGGAFTTPNGGIARLNANGSLDVSFDPEQGVDRTVRAILLQNDGKVLIGGDFTRVGFVARGGLARLQPNGALDPSFAAGAGANGAVNVILQLPDGKLLIGGNFTFVNGTSRGRVARLNADGSVDPTFNPGGGPNAQVYALAVQSDGKIFVGGDFTSVGGIARTRIARLNPDGTLDTAFDAGRGPDNTVNGITWQPDGKIVLAGTFQTVNGFARAGIARLNGDPVPEPQPVRLLSVTRAGDGTVRLTFSAEFNRGYAIETSTDLRTWTQIGTVRATSSTAQFTDTSAAAAKRRFYRIVQL